MLKEALKQFFQNNSQFLQKNKLLSILLVIIAFASICFRFLWLDKFPGGMDADQIEVALSIKTFHLFGTDSSGVKFYNSIFSNNTKAGIAALPSIILAPFAFFNLNLTNIRTIFVLVNILTIILLALLVNDFTNDKRLSYITFFVGILNPWLYSYSRMPTEAPFALLILVFAIYLLFKKKRKNIFISLPFFILSFYSYFGFKPLLYLLVPWLLSLHYLFNSKKDLRKYIIFTLIFIAFSSIYFIFSRLSGSDTFSRRSAEELVLLNPESVSVRVDEYRRASINFPYKDVLINKYTFTALEFVRKYTSWISSDFLFWKGDMRGIYIFGDHGLFYLIDFVFMIVGILALNKFKKLKSVLFSLFIIAPIPTALSLNGDSFYYRGVLFIPVFIILISLGINYSYKKVNNQIRLYYFPFLLFVYMVFFLIFLMFYFFRYPVKQHDNNFLSGRIISSYLNRNSNSNNIKVITTSPYSLINEYIFYNNLTEESLYQLSKEKNKYIMNNITITNECKTEYNSDVLLYDTRVNCNQNFGEEFLVIQNQSDSGVSFKIFNDSLCKSFVTTSYRRSHLISDYNIEMMDNEMFCNRWIQNGKTN